ncbi:hypothetical protein JR316_0008790 [Psilocybe cubensis]|uniref:Uncharacterized protein n=2 Tax=Psilocybe cubensis TaxID=181762 RepID=A0A8H7XUM6_PSICU|nr:hypothetical protein JR316_0008790 [Psilocybe cubensis]KAH9478336.1 hypothetical protein JR316_0008790 [Psilocybe cubensis]
MSFRFNNILFSNSIQIATGFLTKPLVPVLSPLALSRAKKTLELGLGYYVNNSESNLSITLSPHRLPPSPIFDVCLYENVHWPDWIKILGNQPFDLILEPLSVFLIRHGEKTEVKVLWSKGLDSPRVTFTSFDPFCDEMHLPSGRLVRHSTARPTRQTISQPFVATSHAPISRELLQTKQEAENEANEILGLISTFTAASPSPASDKFIIPQPTLIVPDQVMQVESSLPDIVSPPGTRSSSGSSRSSRFFLTHKNEESFSSDSSFQSFNSLNVSPKVVEGDDGGAVALGPLKRGEVEVFVDKQKKEVTKYLYRGGQSTVLTGGVMLGGPSAAVHATRGRAAKHRAPISGKKISGFNKATGSADNRRQSRLD